MEQQPNQSFTDFGVEEPSLIADDSFLTIGGSPSASHTEITPKEDPKPEVKDEVKPEATDIEEDFLDIKAEDKPEEATEEDTDTEDNTFTVLSDELLEMGVFTKQEDEQPIATGEQFKERFQKEVSLQANSQIYNFIRSKHGEGGVEAFNAIFVNGVSPEDYLSQYSRIESVKDLDLSVEHNQEKIFREYFKAQGFSDEVVEKKLQKTKDYGDLEEDAKSFHERLVVQEEEELQSMIEEKAQMQEQRKQYRQHYYNSLSKIISEKLKVKDFDGIPVTDKTAKETFDYLYTEKHQLPDGSFLTDFDKDILELRKPENHERKVKLALLLKSGLDLSKVKTKALSEASNAIFDKLTKKDKQVSKANKVAAPASYKFFD